MTPPRHAVPRLAAGFLLVPSAVAMLFWNEGHERAAASALAEGEGIVISVSATAADPRNEGGLIHVSAPPRVPEPLTDPDFGVTVPGAVRLRRQVEMYQWRETGRAHTPQREWSGQAIDSRHFNEPYLHCNPPMRWSALDQIAPQAHVGVFRVERALLEQLGPEAPLPVTSALLPNGALPAAAGAMLDGDRIYAGANPAEPAIGDTRIRYSVTRVETVSVIGRQTGDTITPWPARSGGSVFLIAPGTLPASAMLRQAGADTNSLAWGLRFLGAGMIFGGTCLAFRPLSPRLPALAPLAGVPSWLAAALAVLILAPLSIAAGWLAARPMLGLGVLAALLAAAPIAARWWRRAPPRAPGPWGG